MMTTAQTSKESMFIPSLRRLQRTGPSVGERLINHGCRGCPESRGRDHNDRGVSEANSGAFQAEGTFTVSEVMGTRESLIRRGLPVYVSPT